MLRLRFYDDEDGHHSEKVEELMELLDQVYGISSYLPAPARQYLWDQPAQLVLEVFTGYDELVAMTPAAELWLLTNVALDKGCHVTERT